MKTVIAIIKVLGIVVLFGSKANAQIDLKMNLLGVAFNNYGIYGEYSISESMSAQLVVMYSKNKIGMRVGSEIFEREFKGIKVMPSFRFYFSPDQPTEGFFVEPYIRYMTRKNSGGKVDIPIDDNGNFDESFVPFVGNPSQKYERDVYYSVRRTKVGFGVSIGKKWVHDSGFLFEYYGGFGKNVITTEKYSDERVKKYYDNMGAIESSLSIHGRLGVSIGWRI